MYSPPPVGAAMRVSCELVRKVPPAPPPGPSPGNAMGGPCGPPLAGSTAWTWMPLRGPAIAWKATTERPLLTSRAAAARIVVP